MITDQIQLNILVNKNIKKANEVLALIKTKYNYLMQSQTIPEDLNNTELETYKHRAFRDDCEVDLYIFLKLKFLFRV